MKNIFIAITILCLSIPVTAQNLQDAFRLSTQNYLSTARTAGVGGAFGAMGADFGSVGYNPASLGAYRTGELNFSFSSNRAGTQASLEGDDSFTSDRRTKRKLKFDNVGLVFHSDPGGSKWSATNFGFGFYRTANFDQTTHWEGQTKGSFTDRFLERANGKELDDLDDFEAGLAYDVGAIYGPDNQLFYTSDYQSTPNNLLAKEQTIYSRGGINEMVFAYGANYQEKFLFGISVGIPFYNYNEERYYNEESIDANSVLKNLDYKEYLSTSGVGINFKAGAVGMLTQFLRVGASVHSPTLYTLQDDYSAEMLYSFDEGSGLKTYEDGSPNGNFRYQYTTPWRFTGSAGLMLNLGSLKGFVDFDVEYADYSAGEFDLTEYSTSVADEEHQRDINSNIIIQFRPAMTYRLGGELAFNKFRGRAGYTISESIFANDQFSDSNSALSFGLGYRARSFYMDMAWIYSGYSYGYTPYELVEFEKEQFVSIDKSSSKWIMTFGLKF